MQKRQQREDDENDGTESDALTVVKRSKLEAPPSTDLVVKSTESWQLTTSDVNSKRTSKLMAPEMSLTGHEGPIYSIAFDPPGEHLCSGSLDKQIFLWDVYGECKNYNVLSGHKSAVLQVCWPSESMIVSCSADKTVVCWDANKGKRTRKFAEHTGVVNSCSVAKDSPNIIASGSDDCTAILWDSRQKRSTSNIYHDYQVCSVCLSADGRSVFTGGIDNIIRRYDVRQGDCEIPDMSLDGHTDTVTGLELSPDGTTLLSNAMDSTLRLWNVRPFAGTAGAGATRCEKVVTGAHHGAEKLLLRCGWSADGNYFASGSADRLVHSWESANCQALPIWPGHKASVNEVIFHPTDRIIASCGSDKQIILGELPL